MSISITSVGEGDLSRDEGFEMSPEGKASFYFEGSPPQHIVEPNEARSDGAEAHPFGDEEIRQTPPDENANEPCCYRILNKMVFFFFPTAEPLSWKMFGILSIVCGLPAIAYILCFTAMGFGLDIFYYFSENYEDYAPTLAGALAIFIVLIYIFDITDWDSKLGIAARHLCYTVIVAGAILLVLFITGNFPYAPIVLYSLLTPLYLILFKAALIRNKEMRIFISWLGGPLFFVSLVVLVVWIGWTFAEEENEWNEATRVAAAEKSGCEPNFDDHPNCKNESGDVCFEVHGETSEIIFPEGCSESCTDVYDDCLNAFIVWVGPLLVSMSLVFLSFFSTFLRQDGSSEQGIINFGKLWLFLLFAMWVTASLAGAGSGITATLAAVTLASFVASVFFLSTSFSREDQKARKKQVWKRIKDKYGAHLDAVRGLFVVTCAPVALVYVFLSFMNQCVRRLKCFPCSKKMDAGRSNDEGFPQRPEDKDWVTKRTRGQIETFRSWDRSKVYTYAVYWGIAFMVLQVLVAQFTLLFLSWLIEKTSNMSLVAVTFIMVGVGTIMFLLPPVPGVPIYLTMGIVLVAIGRDTIGLVGSMFYSIAVSLLLKLFACTLQQKLIGENLSNSVKVRQFVGINSRIIRSMKLVLAAPGMNISKVSILIGGPDWPTSVLAGLMRLPLLPILVGTIPVVVLITPTVLTGSFTYMGSLRVNGSPEFPWATTVAAIFAALTGIVQFGSMIVAAFYLEKTASTRGDELDALPIDQEVKNADEKAESSRKIYTEVTQWKIVPLWAKCTLTLSLAAVVTSCYMVQLFSGKCFVPYELTSTIDEDLDGDWKNLVKPLGSVAIVLFLLCMVLLKVFTTWAKLEAAKIAKGRAVKPEKACASPSTDPEIEST